MRRWWRIEFRDPAIETQACFCNGVESGDHYIQEGHRVNQGPRNESLLCQMRAMTILLQSHHLPVKSHGYQHGIWGGKSLSFCEMLQNHRVQPPSSRHKVGEPPFFQHSYFGFVSSPSGRKETQGAQRTVLWGPGPLGYTEAESQRVRHLGPFLRSYLL